MNTPKITNAMEYIDEDLIAEAAEYRPAAKNVSRWKPIAATAACLVLIIGSLLTVEAANGSVSNLLAPVFGTAQTEIVNNIGIPIGASVSADGYTLTADAVIGDRYNVVIVYTLTKDDGTPLPERLRFSNWHTSALSDGGGILSAEIDETNPNQMHFVESIRNHSALIGRFVTVSFSGLSIFDADGHDTFVANGPWELHYTLRYKDTTVKIPAHNLQVTDAAGELYNIRKIHLSPIGIHLEGSRLNPADNDAHAAMETFNVSLKCKDGTVLAVNGCLGLSGNGTKATMRYTATFDTPIPLESIESLIICDVEVPVK